MRKSIIALVAIALIGALSLLLPSGVKAALAVGARAPGFSTQVAMAGEVQGFNLRTALARGPVVLYFYPKAFTRGCTLETRAFAEAHDQFAAAGATVLGLSADDLPTLQRFSTEECRSAFPMASASPAIIAAYDVTLPRATGMSNRTSYVIARDGTVALVHSEMNPNDHVRTTLAAVQRMQAAQRARRR